MLYAIAMGQIINKVREEMILDCQKIEVIMILGNFSSLIELLIFRTAPYAVVDDDSVDLFKSRVDNFLDVPRC